MDVDIVDALGDQNFDQEDVEMSDSLEQVVMIDELNPHIIESESWISSVEELKSFPMDPQDPTKAL